MESRWKRNRHCSRNPQHPGKEVLGGSTGQVNRGQHEKEFPVITPRRLEHSERREPIVEHHDDATDDGERPRAENQMVPHPRRYEIRHDEENLIRKEGNLSSLRQRGKDWGSNSMMDQTEGRRKLKTLKNFFDSWITDIFLEAPSRKGPDNSCRFVCPC